MDISDFDYLRNLDEKELRAMQCMALLEIANTLKEYAEPPKICKDFISKDLYWLDATENEIP